MSLKNRKINGSDKNETLIGGFGNDEIHGNGGNDLIFGLFGDDKLSGGLGNDKIQGGRGNDTIEGGDGHDHLSGGRGDDTLIGGKGDDKVRGGKGDDLMVWNNGDGSDLFNGGKGDDTVQVNFNTDLVDNDLQNKDVAEFSTTSHGVQFARTELNDQSVNGLFELDIRKTETLETNFGGGDDAAVIKDDVLSQIKLDLDGGDGVDLLDFSQAFGPIAVNLKTGEISNGDGQVASAVNFENVIGTNSIDIIVGNDEDNVISGLNGVDQISGGHGDDTLIGGKGNDFVFGDDGDDLIVWNNGDGSDLFNGGDGHDRVQVNFDTDLVNDDLQNKDVAEFSTTDQGVQFARIELNDQAVNGLFQLDIRETEVLETNFGDGDDAAVIKDDVLAQIELDLDGGDGVDSLDFSQVSGPIDVNLETGEIGDGNGQVASAVNFENVVGTDHDDVIQGNDQDNVISGLNGIDEISGGLGDDTLIGGKGNDFVFGNEGDDLIVWNKRGDGSDLFDGGADHDRVQVNFDTDLVNNDLQNNDVAEFSTTSEGVRFARTELNGQSVNGLFELDIRNTEELETNFGGGDDTAVIVGDLLDQIELDLDGGDGVDTLDLSQADPGVQGLNVDLANGTLNGSTAINFEDVIGSAGNDTILGNDQDNIIRPGGGINLVAGGAGADTFLFSDGDNSVTTIQDFEVGVDQLRLETGDPSVTADTLVDQLTQSGDDVELTVNGNQITFSDITVAEFDTSSFVVA